MRGFKCLAHRKHSIDHLEGIPGRRRNRLPSSQFLYLDDHDSTTSVDLSDLLFRLRELCVLTRWPQIFAVPCPHALEILLHELKAVY